MFSTSKNADDIVIVYAARTPLCKAKKGGLKDTSLEYMIYALLKQVKERSGVDPSLVEDICIGNVRAPVPIPRYWSSTDQPLRRSATARPATSCAPRCSPPASPTRAARRR